MTSLLMPLVLCFTVFASVSFGIFAAYASVIGILAIFNRARQPEVPRARLVLVPTQNPASGD